MSYRIFYKHEAKNDLIETAQWYEKQSKGLGEEFINEVNSECNYLIEFPFAFPIKYNKTRELVLKRFPYLIIYKIEKEKIFILAVFHFKQSVKRKKSRIKHRTK